MGGTALKEKLTFLENSIRVLGEEDYKLIKAVYIDQVAVVRVAKTLFCDRKTVYRKCDRIIDLIAKVYDEQFNS